MALDGFDLTTCWEFLETKLNVRSIDDSLRGVWPPHFATRDKSREVRKWILEMLPWVISRIRT